MPLPSGPLPIQKNLHPFSAALLDFFRGLIGSHLVGFYRNEVKQVSTYIGATGEVSISIDKKATGWIKRADGQYQSFTVSSIYLGDTYLEYDGHALGVEEWNESLTAEEYRKKFQANIKKQGVFWYNMYQKITEISLYGRKFHTTRLSGGTLAEVELDTDLYNLILLRLENGQLLAIDGYGWDGDHSRTGTIILSSYPVDNHLLFSERLADRLDHYEYPRYELRHRFFTPDPL